MAKALTIILLLAATAAFAAAHPGLGKGGSITVTKTQGSANQGGSGGDKNSGCKCKEDCQNVERKVCREIEVEKEVCKDEDETVEEVVCVQRCFKADKVITVGKGRRLSGVNIIGKGAGGITLGNGAAAATASAPAPAKQQQEVCRDVCNPERKTVTRKVCKKVKNMERVDCRVVSVKPVCAKSCECGFIGGKGKGH